MMEEPTMMTEDAATEVATVSEQQQALEQQERAGKRLRRIRLEDGALFLEGNEAAQALVTSALGTDQREFQTYCLSQLLCILPEKAQAETQDYTLPINAALELLSAINPTDALEAALAVNMVASNHLSLMSMRRANNSTTIPARQMEANLATKFSRTFIAQLEALGRHRRGGKQIVEHVHVGAGGQAVIAGTVNTGGAK